MKILVGFTGFVGSNLIHEMKFDKLFSSKDIRDSYGLNPDLCVYAGVKAHKYLANNNPEEDFKHIIETTENIQKINPKKLVLISTIDVFDKTENVTEDYEINTKKLMPYGKHRKYLEDWVIANIKDYHIVRLPALFGKNLKKNFIYDILNPVPSVLTEELYLKLSKCSKTVLILYEKKHKEFYFLKNEILDSDQKDLFSAFIDLKFTSVNFTDSRSEFQFYPISRLAMDLKIIIENHIPCIQLVTEPIKASDVYEHFFDESFVNKILKDFPKYSLKTQFSHKWHRYDGYLMTRQEVLSDLLLFLKTEKKDGQ